MTGIGGIYHFEKKTIPGNHGYKLTKALQKGPEDDAMFWQQRHIFLGWNTPQLTTNANYFDEEEQLVIVGDVRIDNREELFERLKINREMMETISDIQLILIAYQNWNVSTPKHLEGDFAFIIFDGEKQAMFGARDFSGNKLLYYFADNEWFAFSTKMSALLTLPYVKKKLNDNWFQAHMNDSEEMEEAESLTPYQSIKQIPPGYAVSISADVMELSNYRTRSNISRRRKETPNYQEYV